MNNFYILKFKDGLEIIVYSKNIEVHKNYFFNGEFDIIALLQYCRLNNIKVFATGKNIPVELIKKADDAIKKYGVEMNENQLMYMGSKLFGLSDKQLNSMK